MDVKNLLAAVNVRQPYSPQGVGPTLLSCKAAHVSVVVLCTLFQLEQDGVVRL